MTLALFPLLISALPMALETYQAVDPRLIFEENARIKSRGRDQLASHHDKTREDASGSLDVAPKAKPRQIVAGYDPVPDEIVPTIYARLKVTEQLVIRFRRAYDYRLHTLAELQRILASLEERQFTEEEQ